MAKPGVGSIIVGVFAVGLAAVWIGNSRKESAQERDAKEKLVQQQAQAGQDQATLEARARREKEELEAKTREKKQEIEAKANQQVDVLEARAREQQTEYERNAEQKKQEILGGVNEAKDQLAAAKQASDLASQAPAKKELSGTIAAISPVEHTVTIQEDSGASPFEPAATNTQLTLGEHVEVLHGDQPISLWDLKAGDRVKVEMQTEAGRTIVQTIIRNASGGALRSAY